MTKIILLNAAPRAGKDTLANFLEMSEGIKHYKYAKKVRDVASILYPKINFWDESIKDLPQESLSFQTPREILIKVGTKAVRNFVSQTAWVDALADEIENDNENVVVISDCGYQNEVDVMVDRFGANNVLLIQIYRDGLTFEGDSRSYVDGYCSFVTLRNQDKHKFLAEGLNAVSSWLNYTTPSLVKAVA